jgi:hypothetical protein
LAAEQMRQVKAEIQELQKVSALEKKLADEQLNRLKGQIQKLQQEKDLADEQLKKVSNHQMVCVDDWLPGTNKNI